LAEENPWIYIKATNEILGSYKNRMPKRIIERSSAETQAARQGFGWGGGFKEGEKEDL